MICCNINKLITIIQFINTSPKKLISITTDCQFLWLTYFGFAKKCVFFFFKFCMVYCMFSIVCKFPWSWLMTKFISHKIWRTQWYVIEIENLLDTIPKFSHGKYLILLLESKSSAHRDLPIRKKRSHRRKPGSQQIIWSQNPQTRDCD